MANSKYATARIPSPFNSGKRPGRITKITPHYMYAAWSGETCARSFTNPGRNASCNYCIGVNGDVVVSVDEDTTPWTSSSQANDRLAVTFECANINQATGELSAATYNALLKVAADVCIRNGIDPHYNAANPSAGTITMHKNFAATSCPGAWLTQKITSGQFEKDLKAVMNQGAKPAAPSTSAKPGKLESFSGYVEVTYGGADGLAYHNRPSWSDATIAGTAKRGEVFTVVGRVLVDGVYMYKLKSGNYITSSPTYVKHRSTITKTATKKSTTLVATEVINGKWGNGTDRVNRLKAAGYTSAEISEIQTKVNKILGY